MSYPTTAREVKLVRLSEREASVADFEIGVSALTSLRPGEVLTRTLYLSLDPVMRLKMRTAQESDDSSVIGVPMSGRTIDEVVASRHPDFHEGDMALGWGGWREYAVQDAASLARLENPTDTPWLWLNAFGRPGITAWLGMRTVLSVGENDTVIVSSAAGAVGSIAAQLALAKGARVVGIAGGAEKCEWLTGELGLHAAVDYKSPDFSQSLARALPEGASALFECVGGAVMDASLACTRDHARVALCGMLSRYDQGDSYVYRNLHLLLTKGLQLTGFRIDDHPDLHAQAVEELVTLQESGQLVSRVAMAEGLDAAPSAFIDMLSGLGLGKHVVRIASD